MKYQYFKLDEFKCPCCGENHISESFVQKLDALRGLCGFTFKVTSGYRCEKHNSSVGGSATSSHLKGTAADIEVPNSSHRWKFMKHAPRLFNRIGINEKDGFIHVDDDENKPQFVLWIY